ncbi:UNVERIFIED_CONTAM: hypothetical protein GTU68_052482 [Idotea baltica]|nr:hypothetical protein [Idotea baltica]
MSNLKGKTAIVTGASRDIGRSCAVKLGEQGCNVVVNYNSNQAAADETVAAVEAAGGKAIAVKGDMTKKADVDSLVAETVKAYGNDIHVLVNNVGGLVARKALAEMDEDFLNQVMFLNLNSTFLTTQAVAPHMPSGSSIVNLASLAGRDGGGGGSAAYATSKGAVSTFTRAVAKELGPKGIRCNALCPGMIDTTFHDTFTPDAVRTNVENSVPMRRQGHPDDCGNLVAYLASDKAAYITGANIDINGGLFFS